MTFQGDWGSCSCICFFFVFLPAITSEFPSNMMGGLRTIWLHCISRGETRRRNNLAEAWVGYTIVSLFSLSASSTVSCCERWLMDCIAGCCDICEDPSMSYLVAVLLILIWTNLPSLPSPAEEPRCSEVLAQSAGWGPLWRPAWLNGSYDAGKWPLGKLQMVRAAKKPSRWPK